MDKLISLESAIKALTGWETDPTDEEIEYTLRKLATDKNVGTNDTISRQAAIDALRTCYDTETVTMDNGDEYINYGDAVGEIEQLPPAQPEPCTGKWIRNGWAITCSECGYDMPYTVRNFCPNCGAKMTKGDVE